MQIRKNISGAVHVYAHTKDKTDMSFLILAFGFPAYDILIFIRCIFCKEVPAWQGQWAAGTSKLLREGDPETKIVMEGLLKGEALIG